MGCFLADFQQPDKSPSASRSLFGGPCSRIEIRRRSVGINLKPLLTGLITPDEKIASQKDRGSGALRYIDEVSSGASSPATLIPARRRRLYELRSTEIRSSVVTEESWSVGLLRSNLNVGGRKKSDSALHCCYSR